MKAFRIGRGRDSDVVISDDTVSRRHAELVATDDGRYYLTDCDSTVGTYRKKGNEWIRIRQEFVAPDEPLLLGEYKTTARQLARALPAEKQRVMLPADELQVVIGRTVRKTAKDDLPSGPVERDPETGEIIRTQR